MFVPTKTVRVGVLAAAAIVALLGVVAVAVVPPTADSWYPGCTFHAATGLHCPGCGLTRGLHAGLNGRIVQALAYNPLIIVVGPWLAVTVGSALWSWAWGGSRPAPRRQSRVWFSYLLGGLLLAFWILRNIPVYPLTLLAPHEVTP